MKQGKKATTLICTLLAALWVTAGMMSCARMGQPDGGWYDEVPPRVVGAAPAERSTKVRQQRIEIRFSEFIKLENATENVIFCPPQLEQPDIKTMGKAIRIDLKDSLKANTTYTIDFSDAIVDNNEGNPMGNYTYVFSTGEVIDTLEVSGYVLDAQNLEPVKGCLVGLYDNLEDSAFTTTPMLRAGRTDAAGHFVIKGVAPGRYRVYALADSDTDFKLSQRGEQLAFTNDIIVPTCKPDTRQDTTWVDSLHIAGIRRVPYTHFLPDDICLRAFMQKQTERYLLKTERAVPEKFTVYFSTPADTLPNIRAINFNDSNAFVTEATAGKDTITYWLRDTALVNQDTLRLEMDYYMTDTLGNMTLQTDTLEMLAKVPYEKRMKQKAEELEKWEKKAEKAKKKGKEPEPRPDLPLLKPKITIPQKMSPDKNITLEFDTPLMRLDTAAIHLYSKIDTLWYNSPLQVETDTVRRRRYIIKGEWRPDMEYSLEIDSAAFRDIYGNVSDKYKGGIKVAVNDTFASLFVNIHGVENDTAQVIVYMMDKSETVKATAVAREGTAEFYYIEPGEYYLKALVDENRNGQWDTGDYSEGRQPEKVFYKPEAVECKAKWDLTTEFDFRKQPLFMQKPREMVKQKAEKKKTVKNLNAKRAEEMNIKYDKEKVDSIF